MFLVCFEISVVFALKLVQLLKPSISNSKIYYNCIQVIKTKIQRFLFCRETELLLVVRTLAMLKAAVTPDCFPSKGQFGNPISPKDLDS